jgi:RimJ/RimL family protein N-acetyltransferase
MTTLDEYPRSLEDCVTLSNRRRLRVRPLRPLEHGLVRELDTHLSTRTRYLRFFSPMAKLPESVIRLLVSVDYHRRLALVAEYRAGDRFEPVGLGSFSAIDNESAEVALLVRDEWQRQGVGTALAVRVLEAADDRGFRRFVGHMLPENVVMRRLLARVGCVVAAKTRRGVSEVTFVRRREA